MADSFERLRRVLALEAQQGYQDKAVVGGIHQFAIYWVGQANDDVVDEADRALVEEVGQVLAGYGRLPHGEAREKAISALQQGLQQRQQRLSPPAEIDAPAAALPPARSPAEPAAPARAQPGPARPAPVAPGAVRQAPRPAPAPVEPDPEGLAQPVTALKGVGPKIGERLNRLGAATIEDLLYIFPRRYDDYTLMKPIDRLEYGEQVTVIGTVWQTRARRTRNNTVLVQSSIGDGTGRVQATWFNQPWLTDKLVAGMQVVLSGKVEQYLGRPVFNSPEWEPLELEPLKTRRIVPVYPLTEGLRSFKLREIMKQAVPYWGARVPDPLPPAILQRRDLYPLPQALEQMHFPDSQGTLHQARRRIVFDELFLLQLGMQRQRREWQSEPGPPIESDGEMTRRFHASLPFELTEAQERVIREISADLAGPLPMNRLLQGDVGSGKTIVAATAMLLAASGGVMATTEILAEQHYSGLAKLLAPLGLAPALLTGSTAGADREQIYQGLSSGEIKIVIGTHALIQEAVRYNDLALVVIDEQHRFGVDQRAALRNKGLQSSGGRTSPHLLVMSATPIPRTLALSLYGDLDLSIIDEMPPGRQEIKTRWLRDSERERAYTFVRKQVNSGRQAFIIYPLVEESDSVEAPAAVAEFELLQQEIFPEFKVGLVHGRLSSAEKEAVMRAFYNGETDILVATSVIEVGVDVPNSTVIIIDGANRFGLAQLHQFRGRVGRGEHQSYCILIADDSKGDVEERLRALEETNDGFQLAEKDLELRGPGDFLGRRQSGLPELQMASLTDADMLELTRREALDLFAADPLLEEPEHALLRQRLATFWDKAGDAS